MRDGLNKLKGSKKYYYRLLLNFTDLSLQKRNIKFTPFPPTFLPRIVSPFWRV